MEIIHQSRGSKIQRHQQQIFICYNQQNSLTRDILVHDLLSHDAGADCVVAWMIKSSNVDEAELEQELHKTKIMVLLVSQELLEQTKMREPLEFRIAKKIKLPILPITLDPNLFPQFTKQVGAIHGLSITDIEYRSKLKMQLDNLLDSEALIQDINEKAFISRLFLSYRKKDIAEVRKFMKTFHNIPDFQSIAIWYDNFLTAGRVFDDEIRNSIDKADVFVLLVTPHITESGNYVLTEEYPYALKQKKKIVAVEVLSTDSVTFHKAYENVKLYIPPSEIKRRFEELLPKHAIHHKREPEQDYLLGMAFLRGISVERNVNLAVSILEKTANVKHIAGCDAAVALGNFYYRTYQNSAVIDYKKALKWFIRATEIYENLFVNRDSNLAALYSYIGTIYDVLGKFKKSLRWAEKSLAIEDASQAQEYWRIAVAYCNIGNIYNKIGQFKKALFMLEKALCIMKNNNSEHPSNIIPSIYSNMGSAYKGLGNKVETLICYEKALEICLQVVGDGHQYTAEKYMNLGDFHYSSGNFEKAYDFWEKSLLIDERILGINHPYTVFTKKRIERTKMFEKLIPPKEFKKSLYFVFWFWIIISTMLWYWVLGAGNTKWYAIILASISTLCALVGLLCILPAPSKKK